MPIVLPPTASSLVIAAAKPPCHACHMSEVIFRAARRNDLPAVLTLLADDPLGAKREMVSEEVDAAYWAAFEAIDADPRNLLVVADDAGEIVGCMQITYIPGLSRHGAQRCQIESVRVRSDRRSHGLGRHMMTWAVEQAKQHGCALVQLTTDKTRPDAHRFYDRLGFVSSHEGMKLAL